MSTERRVKRALTGALVLSGLLAPSLAAAFILPADAILESVIDRRGELHFKTLVLEGRTREAGGPEKSVWEALSTKARRREIRSGDGRLIELVRGSSRWLYREGEPQPKPERVTRPNPIDVFIVGGQDKGAEKSARRMLSAYGIDEDTVSMGRLGKRVAYIIGAKPWETNKPQLWIDKELMAPIRLISVDSKSGTVSDLRLLDYTAPQTGEFFPQRVELWEGGKLVESTSYQSVERNATIDEALLTAPNR